MKSHKTRLIVALSTLAFLSACAKPVEKNQTATDPRQQARDQLFKEIGVNDEKAPAKDDKALPSVSPQTPASPDLSGDADGYPE